MEANIIIAPIAEIILNIANNKFVLTLSESMPDIVPEMPADKSKRVAPIPRKA